MVQWMSLSDTVEVVGLDGEVGLETGHVDGAGLPEGLLGFACREEVPLVADIDIPALVSRLGDGRGDVTVIAGSRVGDNAIALGLEGGGVGSGGASNVEAVGCTAGRANDLPVAHSPSSGLGEDGTIGQAEGGQENGEESSELHCDRFKGLFC